MGRQDGTIRGNGSIGALAGAEQIYVMPASWKDAPWWNTSQVENMRAIVDTVKRTYNVDENRVVLAGVSDGATGDLLLRDARHDAVRELPHAERRAGRSAEPRDRAQRFALSAEPRQQAVLHRQRRPRSAVSHLARGAVHRSHQEKGRRGAVSPAAERRAQHGVVARGEGRVRSVRARASAQAVPGSSDLANRSEGRHEPRALARHRQADGQGRHARAAAGR